MPYMKLNVTKKLTYKQKKELADKLGEIITMIPNKISEGLLLYIEDSKTMFNGGVEQDNYVFVNTDYCGRYDYDVKYNFSVAVFKAIQSVLGTPFEKMQMKMVEHKSWSNFGNYVETDDIGVPLPR